MKLNLQTTVYMVMAAIIFMNIYQWVDKNDTNYLSIATLWTMILSLEVQVEKLKSKLGISKTATKTVTS